MQDVPYLHKRCQQRRSKNNENKIRPSRTVREGRDPTLIHRVNFRSYGNSCEEDSQDIPARVTSSIEVITLPHVATFRRLYMLRNVDSFLGPLGFLSRVQQKHKRTNALRNGILLDIPVGIVMARKTHFVMRRKKSRQLKFGTISAIHIAWKANQIYF